MRYDRKDGMNKAKRKKDSINQLDLFDVITRTSKDEEGSVWQGEAGRYVFSHLQPKAGRRREPIAIRAAFIGAITAYGSTSKPLAHPGRLRFLRHRLNAGRLLRRMVAARKETSLNRGNGSIFLPLRLVSASWAGHSSRLPP